MFLTDALDSSKNSNSESENAFLEPTQEFSSLDECINDKMNDAYTAENLSIRSTLKGESPPKRRLQDKKVPSLNVLLNATLGAKEPKLITALLDSGGSECLINEKAARKLRI